MPVPQSIDQRMRVMIWQLARAGFGWEDIEVKLRQDDLPVPPRVFIRTHVERAAQVKR
jgi:hypothetical protein